MIQPGGRKRPSPIPGKGRRGFPAPHADLRPPGGTPIYDQLSEETGYALPHPITVAMRPALRIGIPMRHAMMTFATRLTPMPNVQRRFAIACRREGLPLP